jgi:hypothetical protein
MAKMAKRMKSAPGSRRDGDRKAGMWFVLVRMPVKDFERMKDAAAADQRTPANWLWHVGLRECDRHQARGMAPIPKERQVPSC